MLAQPCYAPLQVLKRGIVAAVAVGDLNRNPAQHRPHFVILITAHAFMTWIVGGNPAGMLARLSQQLVFARHLFPHEPKANSNAHRQRSSQSPVRDKAPSES